MVTNFDVPRVQRQEQDSNIARQAKPSAMPFSSQKWNDQTHSKLAKYNATVVTSNPFLSPKQSSTSTTDDESGSSSGQDEFHLERYSQDNHTRSHKTTGDSRQVLSQRKPDQTQRSQKRRARPGLNIVTEFPRATKRSQTTGVIVEEVPKKLPSIATRATTSIISSKAEHVQQSPTQIDIAAVQLKNVLGRTGKLQKSERDAHGYTSKQQTALSANEQSIVPSQSRVKRIEQYTLLDRSWPLANKSTPDLESHGNDEISATDRSIIIGISLPDYEAELPTGNEKPSLHTPITPTIVVTPAEEKHLWRNKSRPKRPASSIYSVWTDWSHDDVSDEDVPPVPQKPSQYTVSGSYHENSKLTKNIELSTGHTHDNQNSTTFEDNTAYEEPGRSIHRHRHSSESADHILPSALETGRAKSQGWWNLMLSPVLSRGDTLKKNRQNQQNNTAVPVFDQHKWQSKSPELEMSPETPKRIGLASSGQEAGSPWSTLEKSQENASSSIEQRPNLKNQTKAVHDINSQSQQGHLASAVLLQSSIPESLDHGLAAEYFHACAIEQLTGKSFYECQNHSCLKKLPNLRSICEKKLVPCSSGEADRNAHDVQIPVHNGPDQYPNRSPVLSDTHGFDSTPEPDELSPNVRMASTAAILRAKPLDTPKSSEGARQTFLENKAKASPQTSMSRSSDIPQVKIPPMSRTDRQFPNVATVLPSKSVQPTIVSPGPVSPAMQYSMTSRGAVQMSEVGRTLQNPKTPPVTYHNHYNHYYAPSRADTPATETIPESRAEATRESSQTKEQPDQAKKKGLMGRMKGLWKKPAKLAFDYGKTKAKKKCLAMLIGTTLLLIVIGCVVGATQITRSGDHTPIQTQWLNLTGFPPMPTGISTIIRPDPVRQQSQCVQPNSLWSCSVPKESQSEIAPNNPNQPNFRFEIKFRNGTVPTNLTIPVGSSNISTRKRSQTIYSRANDPFTNDLFDPNPEPPSQADQLFLGNTTDNVTEPFDGEETPFFMTFIPAFPILPSSVNQSDSVFKIRRLLERQNTNLSAAIPKPDTQSDGSAAPANILPTSPYPTSQPVRLYNRGETDEHYGFYMYYDKAIFLSSTNILNSSAPSIAGATDSADDDGGSVRSQARARCTFSQTRFLVQIWTNPGFGGHLLESSTSPNNTKAANSATDFNPPGSFPYPASITLDRHGGNVNNKAVYCYGMDEHQIIQKDVKSLVAEDRSVGGNLINPAPSLVNVSGDDDTFDQNAGGIDGGTGGCECIWQNWN